MRLSRRTWVVSGVLAAVALAGCFGFSPLVRARVAAEAAKRKLEVEVGAVRPGWFAITLRDVHVRLQNVRGVDVRLPELRIDLGASLKPREILARGGTVALEGTAEELRDALHAWRGEGTGGAGGRPSTPWRAEGLSIAWTTAPGSPPSVAAQGVAVEKGAGGYRVGLEGAKATDGEASVELATLSVQLDAAGALQSAKASRVQLAYDIGPASDPAAAPAVSPLDPAPPPLPVVLPSKKRGAKAAPSAAATPPAPTAPLLPLPDLHALRRRAGAVAALLASRVPEGALVEVDGLELSLGVRGDRIALGPGPFRLERTHDDVRVSFSTGDANPSAATRLSLEGTLPLSGGDVAVQLSGGPVALSLLGMKNGAMGLADVERATLAGKGRVVIAAAGDAMTFDVDVKVRGLAVHHAKLATDTLRGLDFGVAARGLLDDQGQLRLDDAELEMGALHLHGRGALEETPEHLSAALSFDVPTAACQLLFDSVPTALLPTLRGARMAGTFGARGRLAFDTRKLDDLALDYTIADECRMVEVPGDLSRDRFTQAFSHHVYGPDGKISEEQTGPGTASWTDLDHISPFMQVAVLTTEDGAFMHHKGFNHAAIKSSLVANLKARKFLRGASTITMQLAKNLFLFRDKTLSRKLEEVILTDYLEQIFRKDDMMELYLNIIEFGPNLYGVTRAAEHYFGRKPEELNLAECLYLSSIMPSPIKNYRIYEKGEVPESWMKHVRQLMEIAERTGKITKAELAEGLTETIVFHHSDAPPPPPRVPASVIHVTSDDEAQWQQLN
jgi:Transglycosylase